MTPEQWDRVRELFHAALDVPPDRRAEFLQTCDDAAIKAEVESLLGNTRGAPGVLDQPALEQLRTALQQAFSPLRKTSFAAGDKLGTFEILGPLGAGGMGEVYRARDLRLKREVALKVLPEIFASDPERMFRFQREAEVLASLNHPHIAQIYGAEDRALIMELVDGDVLSGPMPIQKALHCARQIAEALEYAHEKGIVHRDLKPANLKVTSSGVLKVLDFGLAKAIEKPDSGTDPSLSPTETVAATGSGMIIGTPSYMSPEQAAGKPVDRRTDIWSFGVVLWELLTGTRLFQGESVAHTLADVLRADIDFGRLPAQTPAAIRNLLMRCLERDLTSRLGGLGEARLVIQKCLAEPVEAPLRASVGPGQARPEKAASPPAKARIWAAAAIVLAAAIGAAIWLPTRSDKPFPGPREWRQVTNFPDSATSPALSRDGHMLTFTRGGAFFLGKNEIYVKLLPDGPSVQLTHDGVPKMTPAFSPDGSRIAYTVAGFHTWVVPVLAGGAPQLLLSNAEGLTWLDSHRILFSENHKGGMGLEIAMENRTSQREIYLPKPEGMAHFSSPSPDGKQILVVEMVGTGPLIPCRLVPFDGSSRGRQVGPPKGQCESALWTPDGKWMYFISDQDGGFHIWRQRANSNKLEQVTFGPSQEQGLAISPDGRWLYTSVGTDHGSIWVHDANGDREISGEDVPTSTPLFSVDGQHVYYTARGELWEADLATNRVEEALPGVALTGVGFSLDGKSILYLAADKTAWIAGIGRGAAPRSLPLEKGAGALQLGVSGKLYFLAKDGNEAYMYRMNLDGSGRQKILPNVPGALRISPDEQWALDPLGRGPGVGVRVYPLHGGPSVKFCVKCQPRWSVHGKALIVTFRTVLGFAGVTVAIPLRPGQVLPPIPRGGFRGPEDMAKLPGAMLIPFEFADVSPGLSMYAYRNGSHQQNIYRIPLP